MQKAIHPLAGDTPGTHRQVEAYHFGTAGARPRIYIQAGLHAGEIPGMLVARHLLDHLSKFEAAGRIVGEIIVVPVANPIGLSQGFLQDHIGRFELHSGQNFNRYYPDLEALVVPRLEGKLTQDAHQNLQTIRIEMTEALNNDVRKTDLDEQRRILLGLALPSDMVLDLHCDLDAELHHYTTNNSLDWGDQLARYLGAVVVLLSDESGGNAFDESCSTPWKRLADRFGDRFPIPIGCQASTVELRGLGDVDDTICGADAAHIADWLIAVGAVSGDIPPPKFGPGDLVPLAGTDDIIAPTGGILSFRVAVGTRVEPGTIICDLIDPVTGIRHALATRANGILYAREHRRFVRRGESVGQVSGAIPLRTGSLLAAR
jgi:predicted deacylase